MKIIHIHETDGETASGGAAIAMNRLHHGLKDVGVDSKFICKKKTPGCDDAIEIKRNIPVKIIERILGWVTINLGLNCLHNIGCLSILRMPEFKEADIIHMHGMNGGFFSYLILPCIAKKKPIVYTLHDMFTYTGHCTISLECEKWLTGCRRQCPHPEVYPAIKRQNTRFEWKLKRNVFTRAKPNIVTVSDKQCDQVVRSLLSECPVFKIPHGLDTNLYHPLDRDTCRLQLGLPLDHKVILFGASDMMRHGKGSDVLEAALIKLPSALKKKVTLLTFGLHGKDVSDRTGMSSVNLGYVADANQMVSLYSAADIFVMPSRQESFGLVTLESIACGTPVVSFDVGAAADLVLTGKTGYLAERENSEELTRGIVYLLDDDDRFRQMQIQCRQLAVAEYSFDLWIDRHQSLYRDVLHERIGKKIKRA